MVALGILVPSVQVRILVSQPYAGSRPLGAGFLDLETAVPLFSFVPLLHDIEGLLLSTLI